MSFLDGDDVWFPHSLNRQIALFDRHGDAAMVCASTLWWRSWDGASGDSCDTVVSRAPRRDVPIEPPAFAAAMIRDGAAVPCNCSTAVRTADLRELNGFDVSFRDLYEDQMLYAKLGLERQVVVSTDCLGKYRQHDGQCCVHAAEQGTVGNARRRFLEWLAGWTEERGLHEPSLRRELQSALGESRPGPKRRPVSHAANIVSIVVTVSPGRNDLEETLSSGLAQTHPTTELIVVAAGDVAGLDPGRSSYGVESRPGAARRAPQSRIACLERNSGRVRQAGERLLPGAALIGHQELARDSDCALASGRCIVTREYHSDPEFPQQPLVTADHYEVMLGPKLHPHTGGRDLPALGARGLRSLRRVRSRRSTTGISTFAS